MKKALSLILAVLMLVGVSAITFSCKAPAKYTVGICQLTPHAALDAATKGFKDQLKKELGEDVKFIYQDAAGDPATCNTIVADFVAKDVDLIMANATPALQAAAEATDKIPILGTSITEYGVALGIDNFTGTAGNNVSGTADLAPLDKQAEMIKELFPDAKTVALLYCSAEPNSKYQVNKIREYLVNDHGFKNEDIKDCSFGDTNDVNAIATTAAQCDVIYVPTDNTVANCAPAVLAAIGNTPVIAGEQGICSGCGVATLSIDYYDLGVATGKMAAKILRGEADIKKMAVEYVPIEKCAKLYNADRCKELGIDTAALEAKGYKAIAE